MTVAKRAQLSDGNRCRTVKLSSTAGSTPLWMPRSIDRFDNQAGIPLRIVHLVNALAAERAFCCEILRRGRAGPFPPVDPRPFPARPGPPTPPGHAPLADPRRRPGAD